MCGRWGCQNSSIFGISHPIGREIWPRLDEVGRVAQPTVFLGTLLASPQNVDYWGQQSSISPLLAAVGALVKMKGVRR